MSSTAVLTNGILWLNIDLKELNVEHEQSMGSTEVF